MKLGLNCNTFSQSDKLESVLQLANEFGLKYLELWASNLEETDLSINKYAFKGKDTSTALKLVKDHGLEICCVAFGGGLDRYFVNNSDVFVEEFKRAIDFAKESGAQVINHYIDEIYPYPNMNFDYLDQFLAEPLRYAEEMGIVLALENEAHDYTQTPQNMLELIKHYNSDNFKTNFDATNYYQAANEAFPFAYELLKDHIAYVHFKNGRRFEAEFCKDEQWVGGKLARENSNKRIYYVESSAGAVNINGLAHRLYEDGYQGYCCLEPHTSRQRAIDTIKKEVQYFKGMSIFSE